MSLRPKTLVITLAAAAAFVCSTTSRAAPATSEEINASTAAKTAADATGVPAAPGSTVPPAAVPVTQSKTIELLLQLQDQPQTLRDGASKGLPTGAIKIDAAASEPANPLANLKAAVLDSSALKATEGQDSGSQRPVRESERLATANAGSLQTSAGSEPRSSILNNPAIRFIRENRMLTAGLSALVLVAVWGTATFSMRRSR